MYQQIIEKENGIDMNLDNKITIFKAKSERFQAMNNTDKLQNRVNHMMQKQIQTNNKIQKQSQQTIQILKEKYRIEQWKHEQKMLGQDNKQKLDILVEQCQQNRKNRKENIFNNINKIKEQKKQKYYSLKNEIEDNDKLLKESQQQQLQENQMRVNFIKDRLFESKMNVTNFWDNRQQAYETLRNYEVQEQELYKHQQINVQKELEIKEQELMNNLQNTMDKQIDVSNKLHSIKHLSTKQFKEKFPQYFQQINQDLQQIQKEKENENHKDLSMYKTKNSFTQQLKLKSNEINQKLKNIYLMEQDPFRILKKSKANSCYNNSNNNT